MASIVSSLSSSRTDRPPPPPNRSNRINDLSPSLLSFSARRQSDTVPSDGPPSFGKLSSPLRFGNVRVLNLNNCGITTFRTVRIVGSIMPNLEELCVARSDLSDMRRCARGDENPDGDGDDGGAGGAAAVVPKTDDDGALFPRLRFLDLSGCNLSSWDLQVRTLEALPSLSELILNDNPLRRIDVPVRVPTTTGVGGEEAGGTASAGEAEEGGGAPSSSPLSQSSCSSVEEFPSLSSLHINSALISDWTSIDELDRIPSLTSLRFRSNPLTSKMGSGQARAWTVARLGRLLSLNASAVTERERTESERRYVGSVAREMLMAETEEEEGGGSSATTIKTTAAGSDGGGDGGSDESGISPEEERRDKARRGVLSHHPRYVLLSTRHADAMTSSARSSSSSGGPMSSDVINVTIRCMAASKCDAEPLSRRLPRSTRIGRLRLLCARGFGLEPDRVRLHYRSGSGDEPFPEEMDDDDSDLGGYGVPNGAEVLVNESDDPVAGRGREIKEEDEEVRRRRRRAEEITERAEARRVVAAEGRGGGTVIPTPAS